MKVERELKKGAKSLKKDGAKVKLLVFYTATSIIRNRISTITTLLSNLMDLRNKTQSLKRKFDWTEEDEVEEEVTTKPRRLDLPTDISNRIHLLKSAFSSSRSDRSSANCALFVLSEFAKDGTVFRFRHSALFNFIFSFFFNFNLFDLFFSVEDIVDVIVNCGAVPVLVEILETAGDCDADSYKYDMEKECAFILGLLAVKVITLFFLNNLNYVMIIFCNDSLIFQLYFYNNFNCVMKLQHLQVKSGLNYDSMV